MKKKFENLYDKIITEMNIEDLKEPTMLNHEYLDKKKISKKKPVVKVTGGNGKTAEYTMDSETSAEYMKASIEMNGGTVDKRNLKKDQVVNKDKSILNQQDVSKHVKNMHPQSNKTNPYLRKKK